MSYGENLGTGTLAKALALTAADILARMDDGEPWAELRDEARRLMDGSIELWRRMIEEDE